MDEVRTEQGFTPGFLVSQPLIQGDIMSKALISIQADERVSGLDSVLFGKG